MLDASCPRSPGTGMPALLVSVVGALLLTLAALGPRVAVAQTDDTGALAGAYAVSITEEDVPLSLIGSASLQGAWIVRFNDDGSYAIERQDVGMLVMGSFDVQADEVTITDESGILSCANQQPLGETEPSATYSWRKTGELLRLEPTNEGCAFRQVLLATRALAPFVACRTVPVELSEDLTTPDASGGDSGLGRGLDALRQAENDAGTPEAGTPEAVDSSPVGEETPPATPADIGTADDPEEAIIDLVGQLNACWATGDPARVLPLFSETFLDDATGNGAGSLSDLADQIRQLQTATIMWELAGDVEVNGDEATAVLAATIGGEETLQTFRFVRQEDGWRLDNFGE